MVVAVVDAQEGDHIPPLEGCGQTLKQEHCLSGVFSNCSYASAELLYQLSALLIPCACHLNCSIVVIIFVCQIVFSTRSS